MWRRPYEEDLDRGAWYRWNDRQQTDPDLAAHITVVRGRGIVLAGRPVREVFPMVPRDDYLASILGDYRGAYGDPARNPVYSILTMGRVYRFLLDGTITSKEEAGEWLLTVLPRECTPMVNEALARYQGERKPEAWVPEGLQTCLATINRGVMPLVPPSLLPILARPIV